MSAQVSAAEVPATCWWCQRPYERSDAGQRFCTRRHADNARAARRRRDVRRAEFKITAGRPLCPSPFKVGYVTCRAAEHARREIRLNRGDELRIYRCMCGVLHLGHEDPLIEESYNRRLRRADPSHV